MTQKNFRLLATVTIFSALTFFLISCKSSGSNSVSFGGGTSSSTAQGACYNAYYPATPTLKKIYRNVYQSGGLTPRTYTESYTNFTNGGFTQIMDFAPVEAAGKEAARGPLKVEHTFQCKPDGIMAMEYGTLSTGNNAKFNFKTLKADGVLFLKESEWKPGKKWQVNYEVEIDAAPGAKVMTMAKGNVTMDCEIIGQENITVPAGSFEAYKVSMTPNMKLMMSFGGKSMPMNAPAMKATLWFAKDVGMIKSVFTEFIDVSTELVELKK